MPVYDEDYTKSDVPSGNDEDNFEIDGGAAPSLDADTIERENGWRDIPPGEHVLVVQSFFLNDEKVFPVMLGGRADSYRSRSIRVRFSLANDPRSQVSDTFYLPPAIESERPAYYDGVGKDAKPGDKGGFMAKKFFHFASRLGLVDPASNGLTADGRRPSAWKGRAIVATVEAGKGTYFNQKLGQDVPRDNQIKLFSYRPATEEAMAQRAERAAHPVQAAARGPVHAGAGGGATATAARPATQRAAVGLDDL